MDFMNCLKNENSKCRTENGAIGYSTTGKALVDFNFKLPFYRKDKECLEQDFQKIIDEKDPYLLKYLFYLRDCRDGLGERDAFRRNILTAIAKCNTLESETVQKLIFLIPFYGRWDDIFVFFDTEYESVAMSIIYDQFNRDLEVVSRATICPCNESISLLAKWLPSDNASSKQSRYFAHKIARMFGLTVRDYRAALVLMRKYLDVLETKACANKWNEIDYSAVPSNANLKYKDAFMRHDAARRMQFLDAVLNKDENVKINSAVNFPHEIVAQYRSKLSRYNCDSGLDTALEALWQNLKDMPGLNNTLVIRDGSGSMTCDINNHIKALDVADALTLYCADRCKGPYKNTFITFSSKPQVVSVEGKNTLYEKLKYLSKFDDCSSTNLEATFKLILNTAVNNNLKQEDLPERVLIISDMEFDICSYSNKRTLLEEIARMFKNAGYTMPKLIFWNVNSRTNTIPMKENENSVILVSGFSLGAINMVLSGKLDPRDAIIEVLDSERYKDIPYFI